MVVRQGNLEGWVHKDWKYQEGNARVKKKRRDFPQ